MPDLSRNEKPLKYDRGWLMNVIALFGGNLIIDLVQPQARRVRSPAQERTAQAAAALRGQAQRRGRHPSRDQGQAHGDEHVCE